MKLNHFTIGRVWLGLLGLVTVILYTSGVSFSQSLTLSTDSDSSRFYYYEGWREVMYRGNYSASDSASRTG